MYKSILVSLMILVGCGGLAEDSFDTPDAGTGHLGKAEQELVAPPDWFDSGFGLRTDNTRCVGSRATGLSTPCRMPVTKSIQFHDPPAWWAQYQKDAYWEVAFDVFGVWGIGQGSANPWDVYYSWNTPSNSLYTVHVNVPEGEWSDSTVVFVKAHIHGFLAGGGGMANLSAYNQCSLRLDWNDFWTKSNWGSWGETQRKAHIKNVFRRGVFQCMGNGLHDLGYWGGYPGTTSGPWCQIMSGQEVCGGALAKTPNTSFWLEGVELDFGSGALQNTYND